MVCRFLPNSTASGNPTYPNPTTATTLINYLPSWFSLRAY
jgi:hypothetical protein